MHRRSIIQGALALSAGAAGADWPQWRGPRRTGQSSEAYQWPARGPKQVWQIQIGQGYSAPSVTGGRVYVVGNQAGQDVIQCLDLRTGKFLWRHSYGCDPGEYGGPRATPDVEGGRVFTMSREGRAFCLDAAGGKLAWEQDLRRASRSETPRWGFAGSPLVYGNRVIYNVGGAGTAVDRASGRVAWKSAGNAGYAAPVPSRLAGSAVILIFAGNGLNAVDPTSGRTVAHHSWKTSYDVNAADPLVIGDRVFISSGYGRGCALLQYARGRFQVVWENRSMRNHFSSSLLMGDAICGNDENTLRCLDANTGEERWSQRGGLGKGGMIGIGGRLLLLKERGELLFGAVSPSGFSEIGKAQLGRGTWWTAPVLSDGHLLCRSQEGSLVCLR